MKTKIIFFAFASLFILINCNEKTKQPKEESLWDGMPKTSQVAQSDGKIHLDIHIGPPPPGNTDNRDTTSVIMPEKVSTSDNIYNATEVDFLAAYPNGGWQAFAGYLQSVRYPKEAKDNGVEGALIVVFVVEKDGSVSNIEIVRSANKLVDDEIVKALQKMPPWKPGKKDGLYVHSNYSFTLIYGE